MRIAILSDAHGNIRFFKRCLEELRGLAPDKIIALGDYFGYLSCGQEIVEELTDSNAYLLKGNHEAMMLGELPLDEEKDRKYYRLRKAKALLSESEKRRIKAMPGRLKLLLDGRRLLFVHGNSEDWLNGYMYENNLVVRASDKIYDCIFMGHTHRPYIHRQDGVLYVNVGSCGMPRDIGMEPSFCIYDTRTNEARIVRIKMPIEILDDQIYKNLDDNVYKVFFRRENNED